MIFSLSDSGLLPVSISKCYVNTFTDACNNFGDENENVHPSFSENLCWFKKYSGYREGHNIEIATCDGDVFHENPHKSGRFKFSYNNFTNQIISEGSRLKTKNRKAPFCVAITDTERVKRQRVRLVSCAEDDARQKFLIDSGRVVVMSNTNICMGYDYYKNDNVPLLFLGCKLNSFATVV